MQTHHWGSRDPDYRRSPRKRSNGTDDIVIYPDGSYTVNLEPKAGHANSITRNPNTNEFTITYDEGYTVKTHLNSMTCKVTGPDGTSTFYHDGKEWRKPLSIKHEGNNTTVTFGTDSNTKQMATNKVTGSSSYKFKDGSEVDYDGFRGHWNITRSKDSTEMKYTYEEDGHLISIKSTDEHTNLQLNPSYGSNVPSITGRLYGKK